LLHEADFEPEGGSELSSQVKERPVLIEMIAPNILAEIQENLVP
jgi:hypothetical protein